MMRSVVTLFVFSNLVDIQRARPIENETETTPSPFDDDLGFTTPSTDKGIIATVGITTQLNCTVLEHSTD